MERRVGGLCVCVETGMLSSPDSREASEGGISTFGSGTETKTFPGPYLYLQMQTHPHSPSEPLATDLGSYPSRDGPRFIVSGMTGGEIGQGREMQLHPGKVLMQTKQPRKRKQE